ncbi:MAG: cation diffusion facilitator family transporter [Candidatus Krumholzibacteriota bacterium]
MERTTVDQGPPARTSPWTRPMVCTSVGLVGNILLSVGKLAFGMIAGSAALVADGFHSLADVLSDVGILLALKASTRPPDKNHPYGHHSFETLGATLVALFMLFTAVMIAKSAIEHLIEGTYLVPQLGALLASIVAVVIKEVMARYTLFVGRIHGSPALLANGAMHRSDAISSLAAAAGIGGAMIGWTFLDSVGALVIAIFILKMGWDLMRENVMALMDTMPDEELLEEIRAASLDVSCVQEVRDMQVRQRGSWFMVDLRIAVHPDHTIESAHATAHEVEDAVREKVKRVTRVFVHVEPGMRDQEPDCR